MEDEAIGRGRGIEARRDGPMIILDTDPAKLAIPRPLIVSVLAGKQGLSP